MLDLTEDQRKMLDAIPHPNRDHLWTNLVDTDRQIDQEQAKLDKATGYIQSLKESRAAMLAQITPEEKEGKKKAKKKE